jgi:hypothetical protein
MRDVFQLEPVTRSGREAIDMPRSGGGALFQIKVYDDANAISTK